MVRSIHYLRFDLKIIYFDELTMRRSYVMNESITPRDVIDSFIKRMLMCYFINWSEVVNELLIVICNVNFVTGTVSWWCFECCYRKFWVLKLLSNMFNGRINILKRLCAVLLCQEETLKRSKSKNWPGKCLRNVIYLIVTLYKLVYDPSLFVHVTTSYKT